VPNKVLEGYCRHGQGLRTGRAWDDTMPAYFLLKLAWAWERG